MKRTTTCSLLLLVFAALLCWTQAAMANYLSDGTVSADCNGYALTVNANSLDPSATYTADYSVQLSGCVAQTETVTGRIPINTINGKGAGSALWRSGLTLNGTCFVSGIATLTQNPGSQVTLTPQQPAGFACSPPPCTGSIGDFVWQDTNGNGIQDPGEPGIANVTVRLRNSAGTVIATTTTSSTGAYHFTGLCTGSYTVVVDATTLPSGFTPTLCGAGGAGGAAVDSNCTGAVTLTTDNSSDQTIDFGYVPPPPPCTGTIGDFVWQDVNRNGIQDAGEPGIAGVVVQLTNSAGVVIATTTTSSTGAYQFSGLCAGTYTVVVVQSTLPAGFTPTLCGAGSAAVDSNCSGVVALPANNSSDQTIDFGYVPPLAQCTGSIGDFIWSDLNGNGIQEVGEPGINGVTVRLRNSAGAVIGTTTTPTAGGSAGYYQFAGLCAGSYTVEVDTTTLPSGSTPTLCNAGAAAVDSNCSGAVTLPANNSSDQTIDFGYKLPGKNFSIGPSSMEGHLTILPGDWINGGYSFKFKTGSHGATNFTVSSTVSVDVTCPKGGGAGGTITVDLGSKTFAIPAGNTDWLPTGDANSVLSWMGSAQAPNVCNGFPMDNARGAVYKATVLQSPPTGSLVDFRFKYRDPNAKGKGNVNCLDTSDPRRAKADVCGASWSGTVTDP